MLLRLLCICLFFITSVNAISQLIDEKDFIFYGVKEGLSDNYITGIVQDANGYIWISTRRGLNRFDGKSFKHFFRNDKYNPVPDNSIYAMRLISNNELLLSTDDGAQVISTTTLKQLNLPVANDELLRYWSNSCMATGKDADGNYGVSTKTGFYIFSSSGKLKNRFDYYTRADIGTWMIFGDDIHKLPDGNLLQLNKDGALIYDRKKNLFINAFEKYPVLNLLLGNRDNNLFFALNEKQFVHLNNKTNSFDIVDIVLGKIASTPSCINLLSNISWMTIPAKVNDSTWALNVTTKGFFLITINPVTKNVSCSPKKYLSDKFCTYLFADRNNKLWIGTIEGVFKQDTHRNIVESFTLSDTTKNADATALYISHDKIIAGTNTNRVFVIDKYSKKIIKNIQLPVSATLSNYVRSFCFFARDTIWAGTSSGLYWIELKKFSFGPVEFNKDALSSSIYLLHTDKKNNIWVPTYLSNSIYYYERETRSFKFINGDNHPLFRTNIVSIAEDKYGNIWLAGDAIVRWNRATKKIDTLIEKLHSQQGFKRGSWIMADSDGEIWARLNDDGFARITGNAKHFRPNILAQEKVAYISPTLYNDKIYVFTNKASGYFDIKSSTAISITNRDGLPQNAATSFFFTQDVSDGSVWFASKKNIYRIPALLPTAQLKAPDIKITALSILNDTLINYPQDRITLNHQQSDINIYFSAINYADPENMHFSYRIKNKKDSTWIEAGEQQNILLTNISPGNYKIELRVSALDNKWAEQIRILEIEVKPPFWKTPIFRIIAFTLLAAVVYILYRFRIAQVKQKANIDKLLAQTEMKALHAQMNPHFIFNCLNSIREMILNNENEQASLYLSKFARLIRITLNQSSQQFVSLTDTIDYLERYIEMEKIRSSHFSYTIDINNGLQKDDIMFPPMLIQPFIENAIWHGAPHKNEIHIHISFEKQDNELICKVEDNGIGIEASLKKKEGVAHEQAVGIANIRQRIDLLNEKYNIKSAIKIEDKSIIPGSTGTGTRITLNLPVKSNENLWNS